MGAHLRIVSGNLCNGAADPEAFADLVQSWAADAVAVQELGPDQADALARVFPHGRLEPDREFVGMGIALRRPADLERLPLAHRDGRIARLDPAHWPELARPVEILNVHISAPHSRPIWAQPARRRRQLEGILGYVDSAPDRALALVGDFNATPLWPLYQRVAARLDDVALAHARRCNARPGKTWPRWGPGRLLRIDHCFARGLGVENFAVVDIPGSDHCALVVDLTLA
jgi:endonuclease/exonuclease/phosphatase family metal-dependent hydrolase